ncbi:hypothetical protein AB4O84_23575 [Citrobacter freundii]|uniref:hypothetical protein n=1 Tax=Citrobacter freundii TaxID=546 RepID=UPI0034D3FDB0
MDEFKGVFPLPITDLKGLKFDAKTGELQLDVVLPHPAGDIPLRLQFSAGVTQSLALNLARTHKFLDEQIEGTPVTNVLQ